MQVRFSSHAQRQLRMLQRYITHQSGYPARAQAYVERIIAFCERLETFPARGTPRHDILPGLRIIGFEHRITIAFMVWHDHVLIEGIFYGGQTIATDSDPSP